MVFVEFSFHWNYSFTSYDSVAIASFRAADCTLEAVVQDTYLQEHFTVIF